MINVSVVLATPDRQQLIELQLTQGSCAWDAVLLALDAGLDATALTLSASSALEPTDMEPRGPVVSSANQRDALTRETTIIGIYGRVVEKGHLLEEGDRVELYRPLILDPMEQRRRRARQKGSTIGK